MTDENRPPLNARRFDADDERDDFIRVKVKAELRKRMKALRAQLNADARATRSRAIAERVAASDAWQRAKSVALYWPMEREIDVTLLIDAALASGKTVALPRVERETNEIVMHQYIAGDALAQSPFGVSEPSKTAPVVAPQSLDLIVVPALVIDAAGMRVGYGGGYYDRLLPNAPQAETIGVAYDFQFVAELPFLKHDQPVQLVITDARTHDPRSAA